MQLVPVFEHVGGNFPVGLECVVFTLGHIAERALPGIRDVTLEGRLEALNLVTAGGEEKSGPVGVRDRNVGADQLLGRGGKQQFR